jgi:protein-S-isoprenylcysteine O-methyltransferase Ste14
VLRRTLLLALALCLLAPIAAHAESVTTWDFSNKNIPGQWDVGGWSAATPEEGGLHVSSRTDGAMMRAPDVPGGIDAVRFSFSAAAPQSALFLWHPHTLPAGQFYQVPLTVPAGHPSTADLDLTTVQGWDRGSDKVGIALPAGADLTIRRIDLVTWSPADKLAFAWNSFWTFDFFGATSINFLWGPIIRFAPVTQDALFSTPPPQGWSADRVFLALLAIAAVAALLLRFVQKWSRRRALLLFFGIGAGLWLFFDLRMGAEFLTHAVQDVQTQFLPPAGKRTYRTFENFYDAITVSVPALTKHPTYGFLYPKGAPLESRVRYLTYPSLPVGSSAPEAKNVKAWLIFRRSDVRVDDKGNLTEGGMVLASGGKVTQRFDETSFLYELP